jgi:hypothetical protein
MSENDDIKPFHARDVTSGQEAADAVAAVLKHAQERDAAAKTKAPGKKQPKWLLPLGVNLGVFAAYLLVWQPPWVVINRIAPPPTEERIELTSNAMYMALNRIEGYRISNGRLPATLAEAGVTQEGLEYTLQGPLNYVLVAEVGEELLQFNSSVQTAQEWGQSHANSMSLRIGG